MKDKLGPQKQGPLHDYSLTVTLAFMFVVSWIAQGVFQWTEEAHRAAEAGHAFGWGEFLPIFGSATFENWQSEFLQLFTFVVLTSFLLHRGSPESRDGDDQVNEALARIEKRLDKLVASDVLDNRDRQERQHLQEDIDMARRMFSARAD